MNNNKLSVEHDALVKKLEHRAEETLQDLQSLFSRDVDTYDLQYYEEVATAVDTFIASLKTAQRARKVRLEHLMLRYGDSHV